MERVSHIAAKGRHYLALLEINHADYAVSDSPESTLVVVYLGCLVDHSLSVILLSVLFLIVSDGLVNDAGAEKHKHQGYAHSEEGQRKDEADHDCEDNKTEAGVRIITVRSETLKCSEHIDGPCGIEEAGSCFQDQVLSLNVFTVDDSELE